VLLNKEHYFLKGIKLRVNIGTDSLDISITRSRRKTIGIIIDAEGNIKVACPLRTTDKRINDVIGQKAPWIIKKLSEIKQRPSVIQKKYIDGEHLLYLGDTCTLRLIAQNKGQKKPFVILNDSNIGIVYKDSISTDEIISTLKHWYTQQFKAIVGERIDYFSGIIGVSPSRITVRQQKSRWGSCSSKGNINLNLRLILAPANIIDYVIVHELCHMREMNHSKKFWNLVGSYFPDYKGCKAWLKANGSALII
jgi:predicted metal-dependent hydrolase